MQSLYLELHALITQETGKLILNQKDKILNKKKILVLGLIYLQP